MHHGPFTWRRVHPMTGYSALYDQIKRSLEHVCDFSQSSGCSLSSSAFQVGNVTLSNLSLVRDVELRFTAPLAERTQSILAAGDSINDLFRNEGYASANLFSRARNQTGSAEIFVGFLCLGDKYFVLLARKDSDLTLIGPFKPNVHDTYLSVVNLSAVADGNDGDRSGVLDEDDAPIANAKPATRNALEPSNIARSVVRSRKSQDCADFAYYSGDLRIGEKGGPGVSLHGSNFELLMSALGQKRTSRPEISMSALPPKTDVIQHIGFVV
jgi:hypothetical protein